MAITQDEHITAILAGDAKGLQQIYDLYLNRIARFIVSKGGATDDAKDVFQDALIIIFEKAQSPDFILSSQFYTFLYGVCRNLWSNRMKKKGASEVIISDDNTYTSEEDIVALLEQEEERAVFWNAFDKLGADCQRLLELFFQKKRMDFIQKELGHGSVNYTKKRKYLCKERLVELVKSDDRFSEIKY